MFRRDPKRRSPSQPASRRSARESDRSRAGDSPETAGGNGPRSESFVLYVEGARDREILAGWARHVAPILGRTLERSTVILGGRQPARAVEDFERRGGAPAGLAGLVVLDRDDHADHTDHAVGSEARLALAPGLELFVWSLRHIESYLLVPAAIRRVVRPAPDESRLAAWLAEHAGERAAAASVDQTTWRVRGPHAKRLLGVGGALCESLGVELRPGEIARSMRRDELHADVHALFARIADLRGVPSQTPSEPVIRSAAVEPSRD